MEQNPNPKKWRAMASTKLTKAKPDQIWPLFTDFFNLNKWLPTVATCHGVQGSNGEAGCIRFCSGSTIGSNGGDESVSWSKERLVAVDHVERRMSYEIVESNIGFESYVSTVRVLPGGADRGEDEGCLIEWSFVVDPVVGWVLDDLVKIYESALKLMAERMEDSLVDN